MKVFGGSFKKKGVLRKFQGCFMKVSERRKFQGNFMIFKGVPSVF